MRPSETPLEMESPPETPDVPSKSRTSISRPVTHEPKPAASWDRSRLRRWILLGGCALALVLAALFGPGLWKKVTGARVKMDHLLTETVKRGPFRISVIERGTLGSLRNSTLVNTVEGNTTIIFVVPEGTRVKAPVRADLDGTVAEIQPEQYGRQTVSLRDADGQLHTFTGDVGGIRKVLVKTGDPVRVGDPLIGDIVCELDSSLLVQQEIAQQIKVTTADAEVKKAIQAVEIQKHQNASDMAAAELAGALARLDLKKYEDGEFEQLEKQYTGELLVAREELNQARENYEYAKRVAKKGFKSQNELEAARIAELRAGNKVEDASEKLKVLQQYDYARRIKELTELAAQSVRDVERIKATGEAALAQLDAQLQAARLAHAGETATLHRLERQIAACRLVAPQDGQVVYAVQRSRRSEPILVEEGATVRERQEIINLPDFSQMKVDVKIHESKIGLIHEGLPALVRVLSEQGRSYRGVLDDVSDVPVRGDYPNYDLMLYECVVRITDDVQDLKPGLTAEVEVVSQDRDDVLQAPVQSIVAVGERYFAWVLGDAGPAIREGLQLGPANDTVVEILSGLEEGDRVVMNPRTQFKDEVARLEAIYKPARTDADMPETESDGPGEDPLAPSAESFDPPLARDEATGAGGHGAGAVGPGASSAAPPAGQPSGASAVAGEAPQSAAVPSE